MYTETTDIIIKSIIYGGGAIFVLWLMSIPGRKQQRLYKELLASGFSPRYCLSGSVIFAFDTDKREFAIVYSSGIYRYDFDQIDSWNYEWETRNGVRVKNNFIINVLDPDYPRHVSSASSKVCTHWHAKMNALLNT